MSRWTLLLAILTLPAAFISSSEARTWTIRDDGSGDAATLQAAIDAADPGDVVLALPGVYYESLNFSGKNIQVKGSGPGATLLDASAHHTAAAIFQNGEGREAVLEGFTIMGGTGVPTGTLRRGGAIYVLDAEPTIRGNRIVKNFADAGYGGGIFCGATSAAALHAPLLEANLLEENEAGLGGGAVALDGYAAPVIHGNTMARNEAARGGAIWFSGASAEPHIERNEIRLNLSTEVGGGIYGENAGGETAILFNLFEANVARSNASDGGGALFLDQVGALFAENTVVRNKVSGPSPAWGGSLVLIASPETVVERNLFAYSMSGGSIRCTGGGSSIRNNLTWQNAGDESGGDCPDWWQVDGNVVADPELCGFENGDYSPAQGSPALIHPAGPLGAFQNAGCNLVPTRAISWGNLKSRY